MRVAACLAVATLSIMAPAAARRPPERHFTANPSALITADLAFQRMARERGQWTAFRAFATRDAEMFVPQRVLAQAWLAKRADPPRSIDWQPTAAYISCDSSAGATVGNWQAPDGTSGHYVTIWVHDAKGDGYHWALDFGVNAAQPASAAEYITTRIASCKGAAPAMLTAGNVGDDRKTGLSRDQSLAWTSTVHPDQSREMSLAIWDGKTMVPLLDERQGPPTR